MKNSPQRIYLDHASITPIDPRVFRAMSPYLRDHFHNPSSLYKEGRESRGAVEEARKKVAHALQSRPNEIFFTAGGTEANNIAIKGAYEFLRSKKKKGSKILHMITSSIEHPSILEIFTDLETKGVEVTYISPGEDGIISAAQVVSSLRKETCLISLMYGNNEIGTINDISRIAKAVKEDRKKKKLNSVLIHTDASQGACYLNIRADYLGVDLMTLDGSKLYGPRSIGALYKKRGVGLISPISGGGQEEGIRPGTENVASIVGLGQAVLICEKEKRKEIERLGKLRDHAFSEFKKSLPGILINGSETKRLPNNINVCVPGMDAEFMVIKLDLMGIACSSVTTCRNLSDESSSYVIEEIDKKRTKKGKKISCSRSSLRFSIGRYTAKPDLDRALKIIVKSIKAMASQNSNIK